MNSKEVNEFMEKMGQCKNMDIARTKYGNPCTANLRYYSKGKGTKSCRVALKGKPPAVSYYKDEDTQPRFNEILPKKPLVTYI